MLLDLGPLGLQNGLSATFIALGALSIASVLFTVTRILLSTFVLPGKALSSFGSKGSWAVVTGASDGLGKEYATQLAAKGFNLILASRTESKLEDVASTIKSKYASAQIETVAIDFSKATDKDYNNLQAALKGKSIAVLINNVGQSHSMPVEFAETDRKEMESIIDVNCHATLRVTQLVLPHMIPNKKGLILTMGSMGGLFPSPLLATYAGSKAFLQQWSISLAGELKPKGITVHFVHAYLITSAMSKVRRPRLFVPNERDFVKSVLAKVGRRGGSISYSYCGTPYWTHTIGIAFYLGVIGSMNTYLLDYTTNMHKDIRRRALRKQERDRQQGKKMS